MQTEFDFAGHIFAQPKKVIESVAHVEAFKASDTYAELEGFIQALTASCKNTRMTKTEVTTRLQPVMDILEQLSTWIDEVPPIN